MSKHEVVNCDRCRADILRGAVEVRIDNATMELCTHCFRLEVDRVLRDHAGAVEFRRLDAA